MTGYCRAGPVNVSYLRLSCLLVLLSQFYLANVVQYFIRVKGNETEELKIKGTS